MAAANSQGERLARLETTLEMFLERYGADQAQAARDRAATAETVKELRDVLIEGRGVAKGLTLSGRVALTVAGVVGAAATWLLSHLWDPLRALLRL